MFLHPPNSKKMLLCVFAQLKMKQAGYLVACYDEDARAAGRDPALDWGWAPALDGIRLTRREAEDYLLEAGARWPRLTDTYNRLVIHMCIHDCVSSTVRCVGSTTTSYHAQDIQRKETSRLSQAYERNAFPWMDGVLVLLCLLRLQPQRLGRRRSTTCSYFVSAVCAAYMRLHDTTLTGMLAVLRALHRAAPRPQVHGGARGRLARRQGGAELGQGAVRAC